MHGHMARLLVCACHPQYGQSLIVWLQLSLTADEASIDKPLAQQSISLTAHGGTAPSALAGPQGNSTAEVLAQIV